MQKVWCPLNLGGEKKQTKKTALNQPSFNIASKQPDLIIFSVCLNNSFSGFLKVFQFFFRYFLLFLFVFTPVLALDHFERIFLNLLNLAMIFGLFKHKTTPNSWNEPLLCLHTEDKLKNQF